MSEPSRRPNLLDAARTGVGAESVEETVTAYRALHADDDPAARQRDYARLINQYYDLVTDFYLYGWGESFHFAPRDRGESFDASIVRHQHWLGLQLGLQAGQHALDVGCGVGGPMRGLARFSGARITGLNINAYQVEKARALNAAAGLSERCDVVQGDFMAMPFADATFDAAYHFEATAHAPDKAACYAEIARVLKPGGVFAGYEWCTTPKYDATDPAHRAIKRGIEIGNALPDIATIDEVDQALRAAGLTIEASGDRAATAHPERPWYLPLTGRERDLRGFQRTWFGRQVTHRVVQALELVRIAPRGVTSVSEVLHIAADSLVAAGELGLFTPMYFYRARKGS